MIWTRPMTVVDLPAAVGLSGAFCREMGYPFDAESAWNTLLNAISRGWLVSIAQDDDEIVGFCGVMLVPHYTNNAVLRAVEFAWHSNPALPTVKRARIMSALLDDMIDFARCKDVALSVCTSMKYPAIAKMIRRRGFSPVEVSHVKEL